MFILFTVDSTALGHSATLRRNVDRTSNVVLLSDPSQTSLAAGIIRGWQLYAKVVSVNHYVQLQIWRPRFSAEMHPSHDTGGTSSRSTSFHGAQAQGQPTDDSSASTYTLVGQTFVQPSQLRFQELSIPLDAYIHVERGDILGLYFAESNPIGWSSVPCGSPQQAHMFYMNPPANLSVGVTLSFNVVSSTDLDACRYYSVVALFGRHCIHFVISRTSTIV